MVQGALAPAIPLLPVVCQPTVLLHRLGAGFRTHGVFHRLLYRNLFLLPWASSGLGTSRAVPTLFHFSFPRIHFSLLEGQNYRETKRNGDFPPAGSLPQWPQPGLGQISSGSSMWLQAPKCLSHLLGPFQVQWRGVGVEVERPGLEPVSTWDEGIDNTVSPIVFNKYPLSAASLP